MLLYFDGEVESFFSVSQSPEGMRGAVSTLGLVLTVISISYLLPQTILYNQLQCVVNCLANPLLLPLSC